MSIHDGHRQRLKDRFLRDGLDGFTDIQVLELLLFYALPRVDTNPIAHQLLQKFGSLDNNSISCMFQKYTLDKPRLIRYYLLLEILTHDNRRTLKRSIST